MPIPTVYDYYYILEIKGQLMANIGMTYIFNKKYRDRLELFSEILEPGNGNKVGIGKISHKSGLPYNLLKKYLKVLLHNNLLEYHRKEKTYKTTKQRHLLPWTLI